MNKEAYIKKLRSSIVLTIKTNYPQAEYRELIKNWGYDIRLSKISDIKLLNEILAVANNMKPKNYSIGKLDAKGKYAYALVKQIGWDTFRLRKLMIKTTGTASWENLSEKQVQQIINILKSYIK